MECLIFSSLPNDIWQYIKTFIIYNKEEYNKILENRKQFYIRKILFGINFIQDKIVNKKREFYSMKINQNIKEYCYINEKNINNLVKIIWRYRIYKLFDKLLQLSNKYKFPKNDNELLTYKNNIETNYFMKYKLNEIDTILNSNINEKLYNDKLLNFQEKFIKNTNLVYL